MVEVVDEEWTFEEGFFGSVIVDLHGFYLNIPELFNNLLIVLPF